MGCTVRELLARIDARELAEWEAYEQVAGPIGGLRGDTQAALIAATVAAGAGAKGKAAQMDHYLLRWDDAGDARSGRADEPRPARREQTPEQQLAVLRRMNATYKGTTAARD